jgi:hypothetical protein
MQGFLASAQHDGPVAWGRLAMPCIDRPFRAPRFEDGTLIALGDAQGFVRSALQAYHFQVVKCSSRRRLQRVWMAYNPRQ